MTTARRIAVLVFLFLPTLCACDEAGQRWWNDLFSGRDKEEPPPSSAPASSRSKAVDGTVQAVAYVGGVRKIIVRGYGLVVGLVDSGGTDAPDEIRKYLRTEILRRQRDPAFRVQPDELLNSKNASIVEVTGEIPAAALKGSRFDLAVRALGNQTLSLDGGTLLSCELKLLSGSPSGIIEGRTLAEAAGPVMISPFRRDADSPTDTRTGRILGGGVTLEDRRIAIVLNRPAYSDAARIRDRLNSRYGNPQPVADAISPDTIRLTIPREYRGREARFLELVMHTTINGSPSFLQRRAAELAREIVHPDALYEDIGLCWEAIGRTARAEIKPLYDHPTAAASYYAARTGLRLGDDDALPAIARAMQRGGSPFREAAIQELGEAPPSARAAEALRKLLNDEDSEVRLAAYEALGRMRDRSVSRHAVGRDGFVLDVVESGGEPLVFVSTTRVPRIAVLGRDVRCKPPLLFRDDHLVMTADAAETDARVLRRNPRTGIVSEPFTTPLKVADMVRFIGDSPVPGHSGRVSGLGVDYARVVSVLHQLNKEGALQAKLIVERPKVSEQLWRVRTGDRPESEL